MTTPADTNATPALTRREVLRWRTAVFVIFAMSGIGMASWFARTPAFRDSLDASTLQMGFVVFALAFGSIFGLTLSSHAVARIGSRASIAGSVVVAGVGLAVAGLGGDLAVLPIVLVGLAMFGFGTGLCDVAMNVEGAANERSLGRTVMPLFHALFSVGTIVGALLGAAAAVVGLSLFVNLSIIGAVMIAAVLVAVRYLQPDPFAAGAEVASDDRGSDNPATTEGWRSRLAVWSDRRTLLIGVIVLGMAFAEGSANDWLALAMVDGYGVSNATGAVLFGVFVTAMTVGRVVGVRVLDRYGRVPVLRVSALLAVLGLLATILAPSVWLGAIGVVFWGLGTALGFPVGMSAAADDPRRAAARVSAVATIGYVAFLVGPPLIGFVGQRVGLLNALYLVLALVIVAGLLSGAAREPRRSGDGTVVLAHS
jgi:fucose permease